MKTLNQYAKYFVLAFIAGVMTACGGGNSTPSSQPFTSYTFPNGSVLSGEGVINSFQGSNPTGIFNLAGVVTAPFAIQLSAIASSAPQSAKLQSVGDSTLAGDFSPQIIQLAPNVNESTSTLSVNIPSNLTPETYYLNLYANPISGAQFPANTYLGYIKITVTAQPTPVVSYAYIANFSGGTNSKGSISKCLIAESDGSLSSCISMDNSNAFLTANLNNPMGIAIKGTTAFITNGNYQAGNPISASNSPVTACNIRTSDGYFIDCTNTAITVASVNDMANPIGIEYQNGVLYIDASDINSDSAIYTCSVNGLSINCTQTNLRTTVSGYIAVTSTNFYSNYAYRGYLAEMCSLGTGICNLSYSISVTYSQGITLYNDNVLISATDMYNPASYYLYACDLSMTTCASVKTFSAISDWINNPHVYNGYVYLPVNNSTNVMYCSISDAGGSVTVGDCTDYNDSTFNAPQDMATWTSS